MVRPYFSIVITTYNRARFLRRALDSLAAQTYPLWEAILIDDGSTDHTKEVLTPYLEKFKNISYHFQKNQGVIAAKNKGISLTKGAYITFLDSDDAYLPNHLASRYKVLQANKDIEFLHGGVTIVGNTYVPDYRNPEDQIHLSKCAIGGSFFIAQNTMQKLKGFSGTILGMDAHFLSSAQQIKAKILHIKTPRSYVYHREHIDSLTHKKTPYSSNNNPASK